MLVDFEVISQHEGLQALNATSKENNMAKKDIKIIKDLLAIKRCSLEKIKLILILQQIDCINLLVDAVLSAQASIRKEINLGWFDNREKELHNEYNVLHFKANCTEQDDLRKGEVEREINDLRQRKETLKQYEATEGIKRLREIFISFNDYDVYNERIDQHTKSDILCTNKNDLNQFHREARSIKMTFMRAFSLMCDNERGYKCFSELYSHCSLAIVAELKMKILTLLPHKELARLKQLRSQVILDKLEEEECARLQVWDNQCKLFSIYQAVHSEYTAWSNKHFLLRDHYINFWPKIIRNLEIFNTHQPVELADKDNLSWNCRIAQEIIQYSQIAAGAPTPSPCQSPRPQSPRAFS
jgi:hypothetical protein